MNATTYDDAATYSCAFCGEPNEIDVDISAGARQSYVEDCQVCCQPNVLRIGFDNVGRVHVEAEPES